MHEYIPARSLPPAPAAALTAAAAQLVGPLVLRLTGILCSGSAEATQEARGRFPETLRLQLHCYGLLMFRAILWLCLAAPGRLVLGYSSGE